ncbi:MAG: response regulator transcription factor [Bacteroidota bacterium]
MSDTKSIRIAIADDHALFRRGMASLLKTVPDFEVVLEASNGQELIDQIPDFSPDLVIMDLKMPILDGMKATEIIKTKWPNIKIIVISMLDEDQFVYKLMELGANGYLLKDTDTEEVETAIRTVLSEDYYYGPFLNKIMHRRFLDKSRKKEANLDNKIHFTERELEIIQLVCEGLTTVQIADKVCLSNRTVDGHRNSIMDKLGVKNTAGVVVYAVKNQLY